jgi:2-oxoglutarate ferredoxin oxidoreductase subunit gamma
MEQQEVMFCGFGGQGIMLIGQMLAYAGMHEGKNVVWLPSYGPEMRGGTAYCTVVVSDRAIGSPIIDRPGCIAVLNRPSLEKFDDKVRARGLIIINTSLIDIDSQRDDLTKLHVPANQIALDAGSGKAANMAVLGAFVGYTKAIKLESLTPLVRKQFEKKPQFIDLNLGVLKTGYELGDQALAQQAAS